MKNVFRNLITIGGGEMGRSKTMPDGSIKNYPVETLNIDRKSLDLIGKNNPHILVIGTASRNNQGYYNVVKNHFQNRLGCTVSYFDESKNNISQLNSADAVYILGGDTRYMLKHWRDLKLDKDLIEAYKNGLVIMGYSAGAICWFDYYDNYDYEGEADFKPSLLKGLGLIEGTCIVHYDKVEEEKRVILEKLALKKKSKFYTIKNKHAIFWQNEKLKEEI